MWSEWPFRETTTTGLGQGDQRRTDCSYFMVIAVIGARQWSVVGVEREEYN